MGIARLLDSQQPDKMNNQSAHTESVSKKQRPKAGKGQANIFWHRRSPGAQSGGAKEGQRRPG
jgi:hypothetical protein